MIAPQGAIQQMLSGRVAQMMRVRLEDFFAIVKADELAAVLTQAASIVNLGAWTRALTKAAVRTCSAVGLMASAIDHKLELLPIHLALDVMAFAEGEKRWRFPVAVMELENSSREDQIAYSLWKALSVRADLRIVFCYRRNSYAIVPAPTARAKHVPAHIAPSNGII